MDFRQLEKKDYIYSNFINGLSFFYEIDKDKIEQKLEDGDESYKNWYGAFNDDGKLIATMAVVPFDVFFDGHIVPMGGIGGVSTLLEERRGGAIRGIFGHTLRKMYEDGVVFSSLYPFCFEYYRKFGYDVGMCNISIKAPLKPLLSYPTAPKVRQFIPENSIGDASEPDDIVDIYNIWASAYNMTVDRDGSHWAHLLEQEPTKTGRHTYINYDADGKACSYVVFAPAAEDPKDLAVLDAAWTSVEGLNYLLGLLGRMDQNKHALRWSLPQGLTPEFIYKNGNLYDIEQTRRFTGMNRIINVQKALELMRKSGGRGSVTICVSDEQISENNGVYKVYMSGKVERVNARKADIKLRVQELTRLVSGYETLLSLENEPYVSINSNRELLDALFIKKKIHLNEHF